MQNMLEISRCLHNGRNFKQNIGKIDRKLMTFFNIMACLFRDLMLTFLLADILYGHYPYGIRLCIWKTLMNRKIK